MYCMWSHVSVHTRIGIGVEQGADGHSWPSLGDTHASPAGLSMQSVVHVQWAIQVLQLSLGWIQCRVAPAQRARTLRG